MISSKTFDVRITTLHAAHPVYHMSFHRIFNPHIENTLAELTENKTKQKCQFTGSITVQDASQNSSR